MRSGATVGVPPPASRRRLVRLGGDIGATPKGLLVGSGTGRVAKLQESKLPRVQTISGFPFTVCHLRRVTTERERASRRGVEGCRSMKLFGKDQVCFDGPNEYPAADLDREEGVLLHHDPSHGPPLCLSCLDLRAEGVLRGPGQAFCRIPEALI
jgi:hypothetical protein